MRGAITNDFWLKMLSLALAVLTWLAVSKLFLEKGEISPFAQVDEQRFVNIPIMVKLHAEDAREVTVRPTAVQVWVRGDRKLLDNLTAKAVEAEIDLTGIESARLLQKKIEVRLPSGLVCTRVIPDEVEVIVPPKQ